jgi:protocatechuate 3,4-dioxygenase beta subunit
MSRLFAAAVSALIAVAPCVLAAEATQSVTYTGTVVDAQGKQVAGASVKAVGGGGGPATYSGDGGKFQIPFQRFPGNRETTYIFASYPAENLAAVAPVEDFEKPVEVRLLPGRGLKGRVFGPDGKPVANTKITVLWFGHSGPPVTEPGLSADASGSYEVKALPDGQGYSVDITADGYGRKSTRINMADTTDTVVAVEDAVLPVADKSIAGTVVDADGKGVAGAQVQVYGGGRAGTYTMTDKDGKFTLDKLADGAVEISAHVPAGNAWGNARATAGDQDITVTVREQRSGQAAEPKKPQPLAGKPLPDVKALDARPEWAAAVEKAGAGPILVVFFDSTQRPSRNAVSKLSQQEKDLEAKGVAVFCVDVSGGGAESTADWAAKAYVPFAVAAVAKPADAQFAWGVEGLPWLILADKGGTVRAEGFALDDLDAKLAGASAK